MKLLLFISFIISIVDAMFISKDKKGFHNKEHRKLTIATTPTSTEATSVELNKRAKTTTYYEKQEYVIFKEGMSSWDEDWEDSSWSISKDVKKVVNGIIQVSLENGSGFALTSKTMDSKYGELYIEYKYSEPNANLNVLTYVGDDPNSYVGLGSFKYSGKDFDSLTIYVKKKDEFISSIKRFAFQNYGNNKECTLYIKKLVYKDIGYIVEKYEDAIPIIDQNKCKLSSRWENISPNKNIISFIRNKSNNQCIMKLSMKNNDELLLKLVKIKFYGGKFLINIKGKKGSLFSWGAIDSESDNNDQFFEKDNLRLNETYMEFINDNFEDKDYEYDTLKFIASGSNELLEYEIQDIKFYPIVVNGKIQLYETTHLDEPEVILDEDGLHWEESSWGSTKCNFESVMICSFEGILNGWPGFGFTKKDIQFDSGTLVIVMKVLNPNKNINIICFDINNKNYDVKTITDATTDYKEYQIKLLHFEDVPTVRYAIQEASQSANTYYIKNIIYYPEYIPVPKDNAVPSKTKTNTKTPTSTVIIPTDENEIYKQKGYEICSTNTKVIYSDGYHNFGLEDNKWCAILSKNIECWSNLQGFKCCSKNASIEDDGVWGKEEDGSKCGVNNLNVCWSEKIGYKCCDKENTKIILIDEYGIWGSTNDDQWCGIINIK